MRRQLSIITISPVVAVFNPMYSTVYFKPFFNFHICIQWGTEKNQEWN